MSSADGNIRPDVATSVQQAIASQDVRLGQHDTLLQSLVESSHALINQVSQLTTQVANLASRLAPAAPAPVAIPPAVNSTPPVVVSGREPSFPVPERYAGDLGSCHSFLTQVSLVFELQPLTYPTDRARIAFLLGLLKGPAREWGLRYGRAKAQCVSLTKPLPRR